MELLLEELFTQLGEREEVKRMLGDLTSLPVDEVIHKLLSDFEGAIARRRSEALDLLRERERVVPGPPVEPAVKPAPPEPRAVPPAPKPEPVREKPAPVPERPPETVPRKEPPPVSSPAVPPVVAAPPAKLSPLEPSPPVVRPPVREPKVKEEVTPAKPEPAPEPEVTASGEPEKEGSGYWGDLEEELKRERSAEPVEQEEGADEPEEEFKGTLAEADAGELRTAVGFGDDDIVYVHGVTRIPGKETPSDHPFMLEEKGIDGKGFAFAFDYEGMRFYLSKVLPNVMSVSKTGVLLLGKQESMQARGAHEAALNDLRLHGILLPFEFGSLSRGRDDLMTKIDAHRDRLLEAIDKIVATRWWILRLYVLDARIAQIVGKEDAPQSRKARSVERASYTRVPAQKKFDIKHLERILNKEKRIAETVHEEMKTIAERSDIDMIVGLGSGSSEDWKPILESSYEVKSSVLMRFFQTVADLQYRHLTFDLMLSLSGDHEPYSWRSE